MVDVNCKRDIPAEAVIKVQGPLAEINLNCIDRSIRVDYHNLLTEEEISDG